MKQSFLSIFMVLMSSALVAQINYGSAQQRTQRKVKPGYLYSTTEYDRVSFSITPSALFVRTLQFDVSYRFEETPHALSISIGNTNSEIFQDLDWDENHGQFGWAFNVHHKFYLPPYSASENAYYIAHGLYFNNIDAYQMEMISTPSENGIIISEANVDYNFSRIGYNLLVGFETMLNHRFFFDVNMGVGARWLAKRPIIPSGMELSSQLTSVFFGSAYVGIMPIINTRVGMYIF